MFHRHIVLWTLLGLIVSTLPAMDARAGDTETVQAVQVSSAGYQGYTTCAVTTVGGVKCWSRNYAGQLGDGTTFDRGMPVDVVGLSSGIVEVATGSSHACALTETGEVKCWGQNYYGQLGNGTHVESHTPVFVTGIHDATAITAGTAHSCALTATGDVLCWGGTHISEEHSTPAPVAGLAGVTAIDASGNSTCALTAAGTVYCLGSLPLIPVSGLDDAVAVAVDGWFEACAVTSMGSVRCWDMSRPSDAPETVPGITDAISIAAGGTHACVTTSAGEVQCWGSNWNGALGDGTTTDSWGTPVTVTGLTNAVGVTAGTDHSCAVIASGEVKCWGSNWYGQLGNGHQLSSPLPLIPEGLGNSVSAIAVGDGHTCTLSTLGTAKCWGDNRFGQLGDGSTVGRSVPVPVAGLVGGSLTTIAPGFAHTCAITVTGGVKCWGGNSSGQLGNGMTVDSSTPVDVALAPDDQVKAIAMGDLHTCVLTTTGVVKCWGSNWDGQLGDGTWIDDSSTPVVVSALADDMVVDLAAGYEHTCALTAAGDVKCWGFNMHGQLGDGTTSSRHTPVTVIGLADAVSIAAGSGSTCAITAAGPVKCWGYGGATGLDDDALTPVVVPGLDNAVAVEVAVSHRCALISTGGVKCWGENRYGQLGDSSTTSSAVPVTVQGLDGPIETISTRAWHTCALNLAGEVQCWGSNGAGQLGIGGPLDSLTPVYVVGFGHWNVIFQSGFEGNVGN